MSYSDNDAAARSNTSRTCDTPPFERNSENKSLLVAKGVFLCSEQHLIKFEQDAVDLVDIGYAALKTVLDDYVKSAAL